MDNKIPTGNGDSTSQSISRAGAVKLLLLKVGIDAPASQIRELAKVRFGYDVRPEFIEKIRHLFRLQ